MDIGIVKDNVDEYLKAVDAAKQRGLEKVGLTAERYAKALCPVDTGRLRITGILCISGRMSSMPSMWKRVPERCRHIRT